MAQVVELLSSKFEALISNSSTEKKRKKERKAVLFLILPEVPLARIYDCLTQKISSLSPSHMERGHTPMPLQLGSSA
jgi:hypothetical protein